MGTYNYDTLKSEKESTYKWTNINKLLFLKKIDIFLSLVIKRERERERERERCLRKKVKRFVFFVHCVHKILIFK